MPTSCLISMFALSSKCPIERRKKVCTVSGIAKLISREERARTRPSKSSTTSVMWSRSTFEADGKAAVGIDLELGRRLPSPALPPPASMMQVVG